MDVIAGSVIIPEYKHEIISLIDDDMKCQKSMLAREKMKDFLIELGIVFGQTMTSLSYFIGIYFVLKELIK